MYLEVIVNTLKYMYICNIYVHDQFMDDMFILHSISANNP